MYPIFNCECIIGDKMVHVKQLKVLGASWIHLSPIPVCHMRYTLTDLATRLPARIQTRKDPLLACILKQSTVVITNYVTRVEVEYDC